VKLGFCSVFKAISTLVVGVAFFLMGCQPKVVVEKPLVKEPFQDLFATAELDYQAGNYDRAIEGYERYLRQVPKGEKSRLALYRMAKIHYKNHRYENALTLFRRIIGEYPLHPELPKVRYDIASTYYLLGNYRETEIEASRWMERYPDNPMRGEVLFLLGKSFRALGNHPKAFYWWLEAAGAFPDSAIRRDEIAEQMIGLIKNTPIDELKEMAEYATGSKFATHIYHKMASIYMEVNNLEDARDAAMALVRSTPDQTWVSIGRQMLERIEEELSVKQGVIGCLLPLSGPFAIYGQEVLNGIQLGIGLFNSSGEGEGLELIIRDTGGKTEDAVSRVEELVAEEKVMAIIGPLASKPALAAARKAQELGVPIITLTQKDGITAEGDMVFRNFLTPLKEIQRILDKVMNRMALKRFGILYPNNSYGRFFMNLFWDEVEEMGGSITAVESYEGDETDFAVQIKKMVGLHHPRPESVVQMVKEMSYLMAEEVIEESADSEDEPEPIVDFDAVFIPDNFQQVALIAPQFPFHNIFDVRLLGTSLWQSPELIEMTGDYVQGAIFPSGFFVDVESGTTRDFVELYEENFESVPGILAATGYDTMMFLRSLLDKGMIRTRKDFQKGLLVHDHFYGVTGQISFDQQGEVVKAPTLLTVSGQHPSVLH